MLSSSATLAARRLVSGRAALGRSCVSQPLNSFSTAANVATSENVETVTFLRLNNLQDNPGAVKKVREQKSR
jgi:hypothetical protein